MQIGGASMILPTLKTQVGMIPAQTQLQTALSINLGSDGKAVSFFFFFIVFIILSISGRIFV